MALASHALELRRPRDWLVTLPSDAVLARIRTQVDRARADGTLWRLVEDVPTFRLIAEDPPFADTHDRRNGFELRGRVNEHPLGTTLALELAEAPPPRRARGSYWGTWSSILVFFVLAPLAWIPEWTRGIFGMELAFVAFGLIGCTVLLFRRAHPGADELVAMDLVHTAIADRCEPRPRRVRLRGTSG